VQRRLSAISLLLATLACTPPVKVEAPKVFPVATEWRFELPQPIQGPLAYDGRRIFVATRDGGIRALDRATGQLLWGSQGRNGLLTRVGGGLAVRGAEGTVWLLEPGNGSPRWTAETGVKGELPVVFSEDLVIVAGQGLVALDAKTGAVAWRAADAGTHTTEPAVGAGFLIAGETGGLLKARDLKTGALSWTFTMRKDAVAPPLIDKNRVYAGTADGRFVSLKLRDGSQDWRWKVGADVRFPALATEKRILFTTNEAVLWALARGGNMAWRAALPSRPISSPLLVKGGVLVACAEDDVLGFDAQTGATLGTVKAAAEIAVPPLVVDDRLYLGLREPSVVAMRTGVPPPAPSPTPDPSASPVPAAASPAPPPAASPSPAPAAPPTPVDSPRP
jgi:outer membrane protein assembly factor BamB